MATKSMALAYQALGYRTSHGLFDSIFSYPWGLIEQAADATWPSGAHSRAPYRREDWDALWGSFDAVTDLSSPFVLELIKAYPDAKVVVVQRDFDSWWPSFEHGVLHPVMTEPLSTINGVFCWHVLGMRCVHAMKKVLRGFFGASTEQECAARARETYDAYFRDIRSLVPPERRLEYKMGSGWEPLCTFLGVEVPDRAISMGKRARSPRARGPVEAGTDL